MSMFKGQGANQALGDGPLLASWLTKPGLTAANLPTRLKCFEQEMVSRTSPKVKASFEAAQHLHSPACLEEFIGIEGVERELCTKLLQLLEEKDVGAARCSGDLDYSVRNVLDSLRQQDT